MSPTADLTPRQSRFVHHYLKHGNASAAIRLSGYRHANADVTGARMLHHPPIMAAIRAVQLVREAEMKIDLHTFTDNLAAVALFNPGDLVQPGTNRMRPLDQLSARARQALVLRYKADKKDPDKTVYLDTVATRDKIRALAILIKTHTPPTPNPALMDAQVDYLEREPDTDQAVCHLAKELAIQNNTQWPDYREFSIAAMEARLARDAYRLSLQPSFAQLDTDADADPDADDPGADLEADVAELPSERLTAPAPVVVPAPAPASSTMTTAPTASSTPATAQTEAKILPTNTNIQPTAASPDSVFIPENNSEKALHALITPHAAKTGTPAQTGTSPAGTNTSAVTGTPTGAVTSAPTGTPAGAHSEAKKLPTITNIPPAASPLNNSMNREPLAENSPASDATPPADKIPSAHLSASVAPVTSNTSKPSTPSTQPQPIPARPITTGGLPQ